MARKLQTFRHTETTYNRPNQTWTCGRACEGVSCALGPDTLGRCRADFVTDGENARTTGECIPSKGEYNKFTGETTNADRWFCTREASSGGACEDGPRPDGSCCRPVFQCRPEASLRRKRGTFTVCVVGLTVAIILIFFARKPDALSHPLNPGPISATHSTAGITCADCHNDPSVTLSALAEFHSTAFDDGVLCLKCHAEIAGPGELRAFTAHTLPSGHLELLSQKAPRGGVKIPIVQQLANIVAKDHSSIACATCHQEHHGKNADLTAMGDHQCQTCHTGHTSQFHSFSRGHPEFTSYPYRRKTRIFFDHDTHLREYFERAEFKGHAMSACSECHTETADGGMMATGSFENTCAVCHDEDTRFDQWEILAFPKVEKKNLAAHLSEADRKMLLEDWKSATARELSPLIRILLDGEHGEDAETLAAALETLRATEQGVQVRKFSRNAPDAEKAAGAAVASAVLHHIYGDDTAAFKERLSQSKWLEGAAPEDRRRLGENLADVFAQLRSRSGAPAGGGAVDSEPVAVTTNFGGVFSYDPPTGSLTYQSGGHADPFLKAALDATAGRVSKIDADDELFETVSNYLAGFDSTAAGKCLMCHTVDRLEDDTLAVNWSPAGAMPGSRPITRFKHRSHIRLPELARGDGMEKVESCASCHALGKSGEWVAAYREVYQGGNLHPDRFRGGFESLSLNSCATCHTPTRAGDSCLLCHQYHATPSPPEPGLLPLPVDNENADVVSSTGEAQAPREADQGGGDSLIPEGTDDDGDALLPDDSDPDGESLIPDDSDPDGESLIPGSDDSESESLIPGESDGETLIPEGDEPELGGESLIPSGDDSESESLIPEEDAGSELLPPDTPDEE